MDKINVGISISFEQGASIWNSGLNQNLAFLAQLLRECPQVGRIYLLNGGAAESLPQGFGFEGIDATLVAPGDVTFDLDLVIEFGASLPLEWTRHVRALGAKIVVMLVGHTYTGQAEVPMFGSQVATAFVGTPWHEVWTLPQHMKTSGPMLRTVSRVPVRQVPHIWSPMFLDRQVTELAARGLHFGFEQRTRRRTGAGWRVAIFEPNISVVKSCFIPMLVCEAAYRQRPEAMDLMMVMNSFRMKEHPTFNSFASHLDLTRDSKASYEPRVAFAECMTAYELDAVVAHHWECGLNYAYYDALYGGYPLVHNSDFLEADGVGLYYPGFSAIRGGDVLLDAWAREPGYWEDYGRRSSAYLRRLAPHAPANVEAFAERIRSLMEDRHGQA